MSSDKVWEPSIGYLENLLIEIYDNAANPWHETEIELRARIMHLARQMGPAAMERARERTRMRV